MVMTDIPEGAPLQTNQLRHLSVIVSGGDRLTEDEANAARGAVAAGAMVIAADSGVDNALAAGLRVDLAVGDFDSVTAEGLEAVRASGGDVQRFDPVKDETDLELAMMAADPAGPVLVVGLAGGRPDHALSSLLLMADPRWASAQVHGWVGTTSFEVIRPGASAVHGTPGALLSLLPVGGPAVGVATKGLRYPLRGEMLPAGTPRGMSNVFASEVASIALESGCLLALRPPPEPPAVGG